MARITTPYADKSEAHLWLVRHISRLEKTKLAGAGPVLATLQRAVKQSAKMRNAPKKKRRAKKEAA